jgi:hypothetical protein
MRPDRTKVESQPYGGQQRHDGMDEIGKRMGVCISQPVQHGIEYTQRDATADEKTVHFD